MESLRPAPRFEITYRQLYDTGPFIDIPAVISHEEETEDIKAMRGWTQRILPLFLENEEAVEIDDSALDYLGKKLWDLGSRRAIVPTEELRAQYANLGEGEPEKLSGLPVLRSFMIPFLAEKGYIRLVAVDVSNLRKANEAGGHIEGDRRIRYMMQTLCEEASIDNGLSTDRLPSRLVVREGGDEASIWIKTEELNVEPQKVFNAVRARSTQNRTLIKQGNNIELDPVGLTNVTDKLSEPSFLDKESVEMRLDRILKLHPEIESLVKSSLSQKFDQVTLVNFLERGLTDKELQSEMTNDLPAFIDADDLLLHLQHLGIYEIFPVGIELPDLKLINNMAGYPAGNLYLSTKFRQLMAILRDQEIPHFLYRRNATGPRAFLFISAEFMKAEDVFHLVSELSENLSGKYIDSDNEIELQINPGISAAKKTIRLIQPHGAGNVQQLYATIDALSIAAEKQELIQRVIYFRDNPDDVKFREQLGAYLIIASREDIRYQELKQLATEVPELATTVQEILTLTNKE